MTTDPELIRKLRVLNDECPLCLGELDTGWECNDCGYDAKPIMDAMRLVPIMTAHGPHKTD